MLINHYTTVRVVAITRPEPPGWRQIVYSDTLACIHIYFNRHSTTVYIIFNIIKYDTRMFLFICNGIVFLETLESYSCIENAFIIIRQSTTMFVFVPGILDRSIFLGSGLIAPTQLNSNWLLHCTLAVVLSLMWRAGCDSQSELPNVYAHLLSLITGHRLIETICQTANWKQILRVRRSQQTACTNRTRVCFRHVSAESLTRTNGFGFACSSTLPMPHNPHPIKRYKYMW